MWQVVEYLARMIDGALAFRARRPDAAVLDMPFQDPIKDPLAAVEAIYEHAGLALTPAARARMEAYLEQNARERAAAGAGHTYTLADYGLDKEEVAARFAPYKARFGLA